MDQIPKAVKGTVGQLLDKKDEMKNQVEICKMLGKFISVKRVLKTLRANFVKSSLFVGDDEMMMINFIRIQK